MRVTDARGSIVLQGHLIILLYAKNGVLMDMERMSVGWSSDCVKLVVV